MAVDKNFVVKNGIEVNSNLIIADANTKKVGIGSTGPRVTLDVRGGIAATDGNFSGILTAATLDVEDYGILNGTGANVTGFATFTGGVSVDQLSVTGFTTFADISLDEINGRNLNLTGIATVPTFVGLSAFDKISVSGISTINSLDTTNASISGLTTVTNRLLVRSNDATPGRIDYFCEVSNAHYTRVQSAPHAEYSGNVTAVLPTVSGDLIVGDTSSDISQSVRTSGIVTASAFHGDGANVTGISTLNIVNYSGGAGVGGTNIFINTSGIITASLFDGNLTGFDQLTAPYSSTTKNYSVTVASKSDHRYQGSGSANAYYIDGIESPVLHLTPGRTYRFALSSSDMSSHPFRFYLEADKTTPYTTNVTTTSTYAEITITDSTPAVIHYQCSAHGYMGNSIIAHSNAVYTPYQIDGLKGANITGVITATSFAGDGSGLTNVPGTGGITEVVDDTSPQLGGDLDLNGNNITGSGNIPAANLTGTLPAINGGSLTNINAANITLADESSDTTCFPVFATDATGNQAPKTDSSALTYNASTGTLSCTDFNTTSDINLKKDIEVIPNANEILKQINGVNFTWSGTNKLSLGVIAQDVEKVLPQLVSERSDTGTKSVNYNGLIGVLIESVKDLSQRIKELEDRQN